MCDFCKDNRDKILAKRKAKWDMKQPLGRQVK